jgi:hypothetical protein
VDNGVADGIKVGVAVTAIAGVDVGMVGVDMIAVAVGAC